ncbi:iron-sulfur cluster assembly scaffold protein NifU [Aliarcobacter butzleri]|uniref:iron-sulfur cluster assembly scaffold protein NifU n=1 Tax=Aliarcobacter butzleri TaxID=28197 RepID=UPI0001F1542B|nr:iron-sulfur cluster assembly scaffold protein NifU [Aliarcobacter butzleri]EFU70365.1 NifU family protein [Aliarcobacter butzleri JV22]MCG3679394.1 iron-sulfur cluster assembly scaffold protein NifU [Aliarcobacter butzleri]MCG3702119.1 iron-sulfur cluster assembly scaffold protein NifU [Aliarcobacter butzleri]MCT7602864.1 iron-sulfur cluster assembly scaffold protein NifU [Aliarcobacter butzleri]MCT7617291.1 iron-sulfur cluster assembly scaffold protein NifU [Aliarcobacter butzleri]
MAKNSLISGSIWDEYSNQVVNRMNNPKHQGEITEERAAELGARLIVADFGAESCGDAVRLYWAVDEKTNKILESKFKSFGCGTAIASSDVMAELCIGKTVDEAVKITNIDVEFALRDNPETPAVPPQKMHCSVMAYDVIKKAAAEYKGVDIDSFEEEQIVCECARVSLATLKEVIRINDLKTVEEITDYTKAGAFCKSCIRPGGHEEKDIYLVDVLRDVRAEMEQEKLKNAANASAAGTISFSEMTLVQRIKAIDSVLDEDIRPMLVMDGGNMEIIDIKENLPHYDLYIRYLGSCSGCASGSTGTLYAIESILQQKIDDNIRVLPI